MHALQMPSDALMTTSYFDLVDPKLRHPQEGIWTIWTIPTAEQLSFLVIESPGHEGL